VLYLIDLRLQLDSIPLIAAKTPKRIPSYETFAPSCEIINHENSKILRKNNKKP
jgi:hypothetical protein